MKVVIVVVWLSINGSVQETREVKDWTFGQCISVANMIKDAAIKVGVNRTAWCEDVE